MTTLVLKFLPRGEYEGDRVKAHAQAVKGTSVSDDWSSLKTRTERKKKYVSLRYHNF